MSSASSTPPDGPAPTPSPEMIEAAAAAWLSLRDRGLSATETAEFVRWLQQDPQHAAIFAELDAVWKNFDRLGVAPLPAPPSALPSPLPPDADLLAPRVRRRPHHAFFWIATTLAAAVALLLSLSLFRAPHHTAETAVGAFQKLDLPDGSVAQLNTASAIDAAFTGTERRVTVVRGEVFFNVAKDPARPFIVTSGPVAVRAVGTAFNVRQRDAAVEVLVTEGRVRIDDAHAGKSLLPAAPTPSASTVGLPLLVAGERALVSTTATTAATATVEPISTAAAQRALAWQERRLEFDAVSLAEVVREFNRYNLCQLIIADPALAAKRFSGTFRADGYDSFVRLLETDFGIGASRSEREIVLRAIR